MSTIAGVFKPSFSFLVNSTTKKIRSKKASWTINNLTKPSFSKVSSDKELSMFSLMTVVSDSELSYPGNSTSYIIKTIRSNQAWIINDLTKPSLAMALLDEEQSLNSEFPCLDLLWSLNLCFFKQLSLKHRGKRIAVLVEYKAFKKFTYPKLPSVAKKQFVFFFFQA